MSFIFLLLVPYAVRVLCVSPDKGIRAHWSLLINAPATNTSVDAVWSTVSCWKCQTPLRLRHWYQYHTASTKQKRTVGYIFHTHISQNWMTGRSSFDPRQRQKIFPLSSVSGPALGPTQPPVQWIHGVLSPGVKRGQGVTLTTHPYLMPRSRMSRSYTSSPPSSSMARSGSAFYIYITELCKC
jgi:hypothetical protein